jgi:acetyl esterase/lipase
MSPSLLRLAVALLPLSLLAQPQKPQTVLLWPDGAPGALGDQDADKPSLTIYPASGMWKVPTAVVVCPGGGYVNLAMDHEGLQIAQWLNGHGVTAFVLKYRLGPKYRHPVELGDAQRAIRYARLNASDYGFDPKHVGIWGFSAGGHLASSAGTHFDAGNAGAADPIEQQSSRPDFMILSYPVITFTEPHLHRGSRNSLLGENPDPALVDLLSNEKQVTAQTPPAFLFHTADDPVVPVENSLMFYSALRKAGVPAEMHIYLHGAHGVGLAQADPILSSWPARLADWLRIQGLIK